jgi:nitrogen fixation protein NifU and related proteins
MADLAQLYQSVILDHNKNPRNFRPMEGADRSAEGYNPLCGDRLKVWIRLKGDLIEDVSFEGAGCAISKASASIMTTTVKGKRLADVNQMFDLFHRMVTGQLEPSDESKALGKLAVFSGVSQFPTRVKCASLSWHALKNAIAAPGGEPSAGEPS